MKKKEVIGQGRRNQGGGGGKGGYGPHNFEKT